MEDLKEKISEKEKSCVQKLQERLGLAAPPILFVKARELFVQEDQTTYYLDEDEDALEPVHQYGHNFYNPWEKFRANFPQLHAETDKNVLLEAFVIETMLEFGQITISAGYEWLAFGSLLSGDKFCVVLGLKVREMLRDVGIASLLKLHEIDLAYNHSECWFIESCYWMESEHFIAAVTPSLRNGFLLCQGEEPICDEDFFHIRKYLDGKEHYSEVTVRIGRKRPKVIRTPDENEILIEYLLSAKDKNCELTIKTVGPMQGITR